MPHNDRVLLTIPGMIATSTLASSMYKILKQSSTAGEVKVASAATDAIIGVCYDEPGAGEAVLVAAAGILKVQAETSVTFGDAVASSTTGRAKTTTTGADHILGIALDSSSSAGDIIRVLAFPSIMGD